MSTHQAKADFFLESRARNNRCPSSWWVVPNCSVPCKTGAGSRGVSSWPLTFDYACIPSVASCTIIVNYMWSSDNLETMEKNRSKEPDEEHPRTFIPFLVLRQIIIDACIPTQLTFILLRQSCTAEWSRWPPFYLFPSRRLWWCHENPRFVRGNSRFSTWMPSRIDPKSSCGLSRTSRYIFRMHWQYGTSSSQINPYFLNHLCS